MGALAVTGGILILFGIRLLQSATVTNVTGTTVLGCGVIVVMSGFYVAMQRGVVQRDDPGEYQDLSGLSQQLPGGKLTTTLTSFDGGETPKDIVNMCREKMAAYDLHFIGYYVEGKCRFYTDILDDPQLDNMRGDVGAEVRRRRYEAYGRLTHGFVGRLTTPSPTCGRAS